MNESNHREIEYLNVRQSTIVCVTINFQDVTYVVADYQIIDIDR